MEQKRQSVNISAAAARDLQPGAVLRDHVVRGLHLRAREAIKSWHLTYRAKSTGERRNPKLGEFPALSLEAARAAARALLERIARGDDPSAEWQERRQAPTVDDLCDKWLDEYAPHKKKQASIDQDTRNVRLYVRPLLGKKFVADVTTADINTALVAVYQRRGRDAGAKQDRHKSRKTAPVAANRVRALLQGMFTLAQSDTYKWRAKGSNPVSEALSYPEHKRRRHMHAHEFAGMLRALLQLRAAHRLEVDAILVMLYAGTRITELVTATARQLQGGVLVLDEHKTDRTGEPRLIILPRQAREIIEALPVYTSGRIFGDIDRHKVWAVFDKARTAASVPDIQPRDMRRTFASVGLSRSNVSLAQIGELFSHQDPATTQGYAYLMPDAAQDAAQRVANDIEALISATTNK